MADSSSSQQAEAAAAATATASLSDSKKRRASKACSCCHTRKVRCDVLEVGCPCTKCQLDGFECEVQERKKRRRRTPHHLGSHHHHPGSHPGSHHHPRHAAGGSGDGASAAAADIPQHIMLHSVPHYPFLRSFAPRGQPLLHTAQDRHHGRGGAILPLSVSDQSAMQSDATAAKQRAVEDYDFLRHKGVFELPARKTLDQCLANYFRIFHPFFPIIDKKAFLDEYHRSDDEALVTGRGPSLLLLQAVLFTALATVPASLITEMGFATRKQARSFFHRKVRYLYDFDYESNNITTIQALLLMSHYYPSMVDQKHTWFWVYQAIGLAQGAGLHRDPGLAVPPEQRKLWQRIWWACLIRDRMVTLGTGRPMHINSLDCNVPVVTTTSLEEEGDTDDDRIVKSYFVEFVRLCQYMEGVLSLTQALATAVNSLPDQIRLCERALDNWMESLPPAARLIDGKGIGPPRSDVCVLYRGVLHMIHNLVVMALYQSFEVLDDRRSTNGKPPPVKVQRAAVDTTIIAKQLVESEIVKLCPTICVTAILQPLIVHLLMVKNSPSVPIKHEWVGRFEGCMTFLYQLGDIYWHASFYHEFFGLAARSSDGASGVSRRSTVPISRLPSRSTASALRSRLSAATGPGSSAAAILSDRPPLPAMSLQAVIETDETPSPALSGTGSDSSTPSDGMPPGLGNLQFLSTTPNTGAAAPWLEPEHHLFDTWLDDCATFFQSD